MSANRLLYYACGQDQETSLKGASLGLYTPFPVNIRLDWKCLLGTNTLAYHEH
jgi:hypothetical protein